MSNETTLRSLWTEEQDKLREQLRTEDELDWSLDLVPDKEVLRFVGGVDISFQASENEAIACLVVLQYPDLEIVYEDYERVKIDLPYIPGFLAFREAIPFQTLISRVCQTEFNPQVIFVDGNGILHPRSMGSASHLGVISGYPTIGVAKSLYCMDGLDEHVIKQTIKSKEIQTNVEDAFPGEVLPLIGNHGNTLGAALYGHGQHQTRNPIYVSVGHRLSLETCVVLVKRCCLCRIPEPIRQADLRSRSYIRSQTNLFHC